MPQIFSFLSLGPKVDVEHDVIRARTSVLLLVATLGSWRDLIVVDSRTQTIRIRRTKFWAFTSLRTVPFNFVAEIAYSMIDGSVGSGFTGERDGPETFDVALTLHDGEEVPLMRFSGDGEYVADVSLPPEAIGNRFHEAGDVRGDQQEKSLGFVELLSSRLGVPIGSSRYF